MSNLRAFPIARALAPPAPAAEPYWSIAQIAARINAGQSTVAKWIQSGQLTATKAGKLTRIRESDLQAFLKASTEAARNSR